MSLESHMKVEFQNTAEVDQRHFWEELRRWYYKSFVGPNRSYQEMKSLGKLEGMYYPQMRSETVQSGAEYLEPATTAHWTGPKPLYLLQ